MNNIDNRYFQWLVGDRRGEILIFDSIEEEDGNIYIKFKDNSRINEIFVLNLNERDVSGKMMAEIENPSKCWKFKEIEDESTKVRVETDWESQTNYEIPSVDEIAHADLIGETGTVQPFAKKKKIDLIPPAPTRKEIVESKFGYINKPEIKQTQEVKKEEKLNISDNPVFILLDKAKKVDSEINMTLVIQLPSIQLYNVAKESFEKGEEKALDFIINNIDISDIKKSLREGIKNMYSPPMELPSSAQPFEGNAIEEPIIKDVILDKENK